MRGNTENIKAPKRENLSFKKFLHNSSFIISYEAVEVLKNLSAELSFKIELIDKSLFSLSLIKKVNFSSDSKIQPFKNKLDNKSCEPYLL